MDGLKEMMKRGLVAGFALVLGVCAAASDGRIPIGTVPYTISAPGSYYLTGNLTNGASQTAITIAANNVSLDLGGHTLTTTSASFDVIASSGYTNINVVNGIVVGGYVGVDILNATAGAVLVENLTVSGFSHTGIYVLGASNYPAVQIMHNRITTNAGSSSAYGMVLNKVWGGQVFSNVIMGAGPGASDLFYLQTASALTIMDNLFTYGASGMNFAGVSNLQILRNNSSYNGVDGLLLQGTCVNVDIEENLFSTNTTDGLQISSGVASDVYRNNVSTGNGTAYAVGSATNGGGNL